MDPLRTLLPIQAKTSPPVEIENRKSKIENCLDFLSSDSTLDRYGEIIDPAGWHLATYQRNPVFQNAHQYGDVIFTLGRALITDVRQVAGRTALFQRIHFAVDANPIARIAYNLYKGNFLNAVSVGFIPIRWQDDPAGQASCSLEDPPLPLPVSPIKNQNSKIKNPIRRLYLEQELLEVSAVAIPANPNALARAYNAGAVEKSDLADTIDLLQHIASDPSPDIDPESKIKNQNSKTSISPSLLSLARDLRDLLKHL